MRPHVLWVASPNTRSSGGSSLLIRATRAFHTVLPIKHCFTTYSSAGGCICFVTGILGGLFDPPNIPGKTQILLGVDSLHRECGYIQVGPRLGESSADLFLLLFSPVRGPCTHRAQLAEILKLPIQSGVKHVSR
jgi:hypothetical protein